MSYRSRWELENKIYEIGGYFIKKTLFSDPELGYSYNNTLAISFINAFARLGMLQESTSDIICTMADWGYGMDIPEGIIFTSEAMYVNTPKNNGYRRFMARYNDITDMEYYPASAHLRIKVSNGNAYWLKTPLWSKKRIARFLEYASNECCIGLIW